MNDNVYAVSEVVGSSGIEDVLPNQRMERVEEFLISLAGNLNEMDHKKQKLEELGKRREKTKKLINALSDSKNLDLTQTGMLGAARSVSRKRIGLLANVVAYGISGEKAQKVQCERLLRLLSAIDDIEITLLYTNLNKERNGEGIDIKEQKYIELFWENLNVPRCQLDKAPIFEAGIQNLIKFGLLKEKYERLPKKSLPAFDIRTGKIARSGLEITALGRLLLRAAGLGAVSYSPKIRTVT